MLQYFSVCGRGTWKVWTKLFSSVISVCWRGKRKLWTFLHSSQSFGSVKGSFEFFFIYLNLQESKTKLWFKFFSSFICGYHIFESSLIFNSLTKCILIVSFLLAGSFGLDSFLSFISIHEIEKGKLWIKLFPSVKCIHLCVSYCLSSSSFFFNLPIFLETSDSFLFQSIVLNWISLSSKRLGNILFPVNIVSQIEYHGES